MLSFKFMAFFPLIIIVCIYVFIFTYIPKYNLLSPIFDLKERLMKNKHKGAILRYSLYEYICKKIYFILIIYVCEPVSWYVHMSTVLTEVRRRH